MPVSRLVSLRFYHLITSVSSSLGQRLSRHFSFFLCGGSFVQTTGQPPSIIIDQIISLWSCLLRLVCMHIICRNNLSFTTFLKYFYRIFCLIFGWSFQKWRPKPRFREIKFLGNDGGGRDRRFATSLLRTEWIKACRAGSVFENETRNGVYFV